MTRQLTIAGTGLDGLIGSRLTELLRDDFHFIPLAQTQMDITNKRQTETVIAQQNFDLFLHGAAYTDVDGAEKEKDRAWKVNVEGTRNVFSAVSRQNKPFIYISTDFVFDGETPPFFEDFPPRPISYYGLTKYEAEKIVKDRAMIVRLSYPYRAVFSPKTDIVRSIITTLQQKKPLKGIIDQMITFTLIDDIAYALKHLFSHYAKEIFHVVGANSLSAYEAMTTTCEVFELDKTLVGKTTYAEFYAGRAKRPQKGIIQSKKNNFYAMKALEEGLREIKKQGR